MRISQLSEQAGLPVGTVKFYLRTGLLQPGVVVSATQAEYDEAHLARLRLIRALLEVGHLSHAEILKVLEALDLSGSDLPGALQQVHRSTAGRHPEGALDGALDPAAAASLVSDLGWQVDGDSPYLVELARAVAALESVGLAPSRERLRVYAESAAHVARHDVAWVRSAADDDKVLVSTASAVLWEAVLNALRQLANEHQEARQDSGVPAPRMPAP